MNGNLLYYSSKIARLAKRLGVEPAQVANMDLDKAAQLAYGTGYTFATLPKTEKGEQWYQGQIGTTRLEHQAIPTPRQVQSYEAQFTPGVNYPVGSTMWALGWTSPEQYRKQAGQTSPYGPMYGQARTLPTYYPATLPEASPIPPTRYKAGVPAEMKSPDAKLKAQYMKDAAAILGINPEVGEWPQIYRDLYEQLKAGMWGESLLLWNEVQGLASGRWLRQGYPEITMGREEYPYTTTVRQTGWSPYIPPYKPMASIIPGTQTGTQGTTQMYGVFREGTEGGGYYPQYAPRARWLTY